jgi:hypothetical protein
VRTTPAKVQGILGRNYTPGSDVAPFIETASAIIDDLVIAASANSLTVSATKLEILERWVAAHCYGHHDQFFQSKSTDGASASFQGQTGKFLESTQYGQMAMSLDTTGFLNRLNKGNPQAQFFWAGRYPSQQIAFSDKA